MRDMHNNIKTSRVISPTRVGDNTAEVGEIIDNQGFSTLEYVIAYGTLADAAATFTPLLEHSDDSGMAGAVAVPDGDLLGTEVVSDEADDDTVIKIGYKGSLRFTRLTITPAGNAADADFSAVAIQGKAGVAPVA